MYFGCHLSISDGIDIIIKKCESLQINTCQIFLKNPKSLQLTPLTDNKKRLLQNLKQHTNIKIVIHSPYVLNFCNPDIYDKSVDILISDLTEAELCGAVGCIIHLGKNTKKLEFDEALKYYVNGITECLNKTTSSNIIIETGAGQGTEVGWKIKNLGKIRNMIYDKLEYKDNIDRVKFCIDTCHITSAGYHLDTPEIYCYIDKYLKWENIICIHVNDNKSEIGSYVDRHADIGYGTLGKDNLQVFLKHTKKHNPDILYILETPRDNLSVQQQLKWLSSI